MLLLCIPRLGRAEGAACPDGLALPAVSLEATVCMPAAQQVSYELRGRLILALQHLAIAR